MKSISGIGLDKIKGVGPKKAELLKNESQIKTVEDLLYYSPRKYADRSSFKKIINCFVNETVTVSGTIESVNFIYAGKKRLEVEVNDSTDTVTAVFFNGLNYFSSVFKKGDEVILWGKINFFRKKQMVHPDFDFPDTDSSINTINTARIIPLYKSGEKLKKAGLDSRGFRRVIRTTLELFSGYIKDPLPEDLIQTFSLPALKDAIYGIHFPESFESAEQARKRLAFDEVFFLHSYLTIAKKVSEQNTFKDPSEKLPEIKEYVSALPFSLTVSQKETLNEIIKDINSPAPMNRLLQGDVGSGKTAVALGAVFSICTTGNQAAIMAPTEILARQHFDSALQLLPQYLKTELLTGSTKKKDRHEILNRIKTGETDILIGTHTLIQEEVSFNNLRLIVIDEQHRFGVEQRARLKEKSKSTDLLVMTATPIPRSLSLTVYGDLDVSRITEKPAGRAQVETISFPESRLSAVYRSLQKYIDEGRQIYYVLPLIEESEKTDLKSAIESFNKLKKIFIRNNVALLHGRMKPDEKRETMDLFRSGKIDILVTTTVIEVGVDVPNANVIVIENAERFGLAQLHQLRGRVGRGSHKSFCVLIHPDFISEDSTERITTMVKHNDGFLIAEKDLKLRGAGDLIGSRQHGHDSGFEFLHLEHDYDLIIQARNAAVARVEKMNIKPGISLKLDNGDLQDVFSGSRIKKILAFIS